MPTLGHTDPDFIMRADEAQRELGLGIDRIIAGRQALGIEGDLLDQVAPAPTWEHSPPE